MSRRLLPEVPAEAEPHPLAAVGLRVGAVGEIHQQRPRVPVVARRSCGSPGRWRARRGRGCRGAGRPSTTRAPTGSGRATMASRGSRARQAAEVFQSSRTSWSSKIIAVGTRGQQPPDLGVGPRVAGTARRTPSKLDDLVVGPFGMAVAAAGDPAPFCRGELVGVDLVAEQQQRVRPLVERPPRHPGGVGVQGVEPELGGEPRIGGLRVAARAEDDPCCARRSPGRGCGSRSAGTGASRRPDLLAVDVRPGTAMLSPGSSPVTGTSA